MPREFDPEELAQVVELKAFADEAVKKWAAAAAEAKELKGVAQAARKALDDYIDELSAEMPLFDRPPPEKPAPADDGPDEIDRRPIRGKLNEELAATFGTAAEGRSLPPEEDDDDGAKPRPVRKPKEKGEPPADVADYLVYKGNAVNPLFAVRAKSLRAAIAHAKTFSRSNGNWAPTVKLDERGDAKRLGLRVADLTAEDPATGKTYERAAASVKPRGKAVAR